MSTGKFNPAFAGFVDPRHKLETPDHTAPLLKGIAAAEHVRKHGELPEWALSSVDLSEDEYHERVFGELDPPHLSDPL